MTISVALDRVVKQGATIIDAHERSAAQVKAEREAQQQSALALAHATFVAWLGDLADELDIKGPLGGRKEWRIRPLAWLLRRGRAGRLLAIDVKADLNGYGDDLWFDSPLGSRRTGGYRVSDPSDESFAVMIAEWQRYYEAEAAVVVDGLVKSLSTAEEPACADQVERLKAVRDQLRALAPERTAEWDELHVKTFAKWIAGQVEREAALGHYRAVLEAYAANHRLRQAGHEEIVARFDRPLSVQDLELSVAGSLIGDSDTNGLTVMLTIFANQGDPTADGWYEVLERGAIRKWFIPAARVVRLSERYEARPSTHPHLFDVTFLPDGGALYHLSSDREAVNAALSEWKEAPPAPTWAEVSGGLPRRWDVNEIERLHRL